MSYYVTPTTIKECRLRLGLDQREFAKKVGGVTDNAVSKWENGRNRPNAENKKKIKEIMRLADEIEGKPIEKEQPEIKSQPKGIDRRLEVMNETTVHIRELEAEIIKLKAEAYDRIMKGGNE